MITLTSVNPLKPASNLQYSAALYKASIIRMTPYTNGIILVYDEYWIKMFRATHQSTRPNCHGGKTSTPHVVTPSARLATTTEPDVSVSTTTVIHAYHVPEP